MDHIKITENKIEIENLISLINSPDCGATSVFIGTTRNHFDGKKVLQLEYEAYDDMAMKEMRKICSSMRIRWPLHHVAIVHRIGKVPVSEASVLIAASSAHRREAQEAVMYGIDAVKASVPIWKKEIYEDGDPKWKANAECSWKISS